MYDSRNITEEFDIVDISKEYMYCIVAVIYTLL